MIRGHVLWALWKKDIKLAMKNKNSIIMLLLPLGFCFLYSYLFQDMIGEVDGFPAYFVILLCEVMALACIPINVQGLSIAAEKEKNTMRTLMLSDVRSTEFLLSKSLVSFMYTMLETLGICLVSQMSAQDIPLFLCITALAAIGLIFIGSIVGILAKDQTSAGTLSSPFMLIVMLPSVFAQFNDALKIIAGLLPTYAFQVIYENNIHGLSLFASANWMSLFVLFAWIIFGLLAFSWIYKRNRLDN